MSISDVLFLVAGQCLHCGVWTCAVVTRSVWSPPASKSRADSHITVTETQIGSQFSKSVSSATTELSGFFLTPVWSSAALPHRLELSSAQYSPRRKPRLTKHTPLNPRNYIEGFCVQRLIPLVSATASCCLWWGCEGQLLLLLVRKGREVSWPADRFVVVFLNQENTQYLL